MKWYFIFSASHSRKGLVIWILVNLLEFVSDFTPSMHDILPIQKVMIQSVVMIIQLSNVSLFCEEVRVPRSILKE